MHVIWGCFFLTLALGKTHALWNYVLSWQCAAGAVALTMCSPGNSITCKKTLMCYHFQLQKLKSEVHIN